MCHSPDKLQKMRRKDGVRKTLTSGSNRERPIGGFESRRNGGENDIMKHENQGKNGAW